MFHFRKEKQSKDIETRINRLYSVFAPVAKRWHYAFRRPSLTVGGRPTLLFLGNHSSGKSTVINDLLGIPPVQATGVAPTDDAFTVILYGTEEHEFYGPAALGQLPDEFKPLAELGHDFLQHLAVKIRNRPYLKNTNLVDSPGMIDAPAGSAGRSYDFTAAARTFCGIADLVLFLFDPDKPGTTGETIDVLSSCMTGIEFKLRVLLNKADSFDSIEDFARAYGNLCWNLARVLRTKDLPPIFTTFTPSTANRLAAKIPLDSFERHRALLLEQLSNAPQRRIDSIVATTLADFHRLALQTRVVAAVSRRLAFAAALRALGFVLATALMGFLSWFFLVHWHADASFWARVGYWAGMVVFTAATGLCAAIFLHFRAKRTRARLQKSLDSLFTNLYAPELAIGTRADLTSRWSEVRSEIESLIQARIRLPLFTWGDAHRLEELSATELPAITSLARNTVPQKLSTSPSS